MYITNSTHHCLQNSDVLQVAWILGARALQCLVR